MRIHHTAVCTRDLELGLRFWREGLGFQEIMNEHFEGDWPTLFRASSAGLHSVFLGDPEEPNSGIIELVVFDGGIEDGQPLQAPAVGFFLVSIYTDIEAVLGRLTELGFAGACRRIELAVGVKMAVVEDPNGVWVELIEQGEGAT